MARKGGLGKGLDALIPDEFLSGEEPAEKLAPISMIVPNPLQPRSSMTEDNLMELAQSIKEHGILQPLIVSHDAVTGQYTLIAGERRLRAAKIAGLDSVPVIIRNVTDTERLELALIENVQRSDLSALETAEAYRQLADEFHLSHDEIADRVGKSRVSVTNTLRLLKLPATVLQSLSDGKITEGHARALLALTSTQAQLAVLQVILKLDLNVRQTEELVRKYSGVKPEKPAEKPVDPEVKAIEEKLQERLGTRVVLHHSSKGGTLVIHYYSDEELTGLLSQILKE
ncbi:MAG: ParB/RepB/Spo0J family partition protein [Anaerolineaceae bacterium]|jgi:ParB family chromosome partitioning protein